MPGRRRSARGDAGAATGAGNRHPAHSGALVEHWRGPFDWRAAERRINALDHFRVEVDGLVLHLVRAGTRGATPLLLVHGWPDSFLVTFSSSAHDWEIRVHERR